MKRITTLLFPLVFAFINVGSYAQGTWSAKTPMPTARQHLCSAVYNGKIYVFGGEGISGNQMLQVNEMYDPPTESWTTMSPMPSGVGFCNAGTINGKIYVVGGWNGSYQTNQNWEFNPVTNSWIVKAAMPTTRSDAAVAVVNNKLYAIGGWQYGSNPRTENEMYDPVTNTWVTRAPMPTARGYLTVSVVNNKIYAIGSGNSGKKIEEYDPATNVWTTMADMPLAKGGGPGSVVINNEIYVFGGSMTSSDTTLIYTPATNTWRTAAVMPTHRYFITASQVNDSAHVFGGTITGGGPPFLATHEMFYPTDPVLPVSVTITASANNVCLGTAVTFTATPVNGGTAPQYQWKVNGTSVGANNPVFTYPPANSDSVTCVLTSNAPGATGNPAISNVIYMAVNLSVPVSVSITASANPVCQGDTVHYTAHMINPGSNASLQWYVNGVLVSGGNIINGLIAYYPFNGNANDASGNGNNGVDVTATPTTDRFGNPNSAYNFAGLSNPQFIRVPNSPSLQLGNQATFSLWVRINSFYGMDGWGSASPMGFHVMFSKDFDRCCLYEGIYGIANGNIVGQAKSNGWYSGIQFSDTIPGSSIGQWFNLTYVFTPTEGRMFSNGQLIATQSGVNSFSNSNSKDLYFGRLNPLWYPLNGKLDDVRFYNRALSDAEVLQLYQGYDSTFSYVPQDGDVVTCVLTATGTCLSNNPDTSNAITMVVHPLPANLGQTTSCLSQGLVAYYPFNGNANDESGNGNVGVISGASPAADRFGALNCSYDFNGLDNYITIEDGSNFNLQNDMSISIWVNPRSTQNPIAGLLDKDHCSYPNGYPTGWVLQQGPFTNNFYFSYGDGSVWNPPMASNIQLVSNAWNHMIIRKINNVVEYYLNGGLVTANTYPNGQIATNNSTPLYIGKSCLPGNARCFNGAIDDIRIYSRTLTPEEIACLYSGNCNNLTADLTSDSICTGNNTSLNIINSQSGIKYQVLLNGANYGNFQVGNGNTLTFPINGLMQTTSFTVLATNTTTGCYTILDSTFTVHVSALNAVVSPAATICSGTPAILTASGGTGYLWSNGMTTPVITVSPLATTVYYVTVSNGTWCTDTDSVKVNVNPTPLPTITGTNSICLGAVNIAYTTQAGMTGYNWTVSAGGTITAGAGTNTITVTWNTLGSQTVGVNYASILGCTAATPSIMNVTVNPMPAPVITGNGSMCVSSGYYDYATQTGMTNYLWTISPGGTILFGTGTNLVTVTWDVPGPQWLKVSYTNSSGCTATAPTQLNIMVNPLPGAAGAVLGSVSVCAGAAGVNYSTTLIPDAVTYVWSLPMGASIASGSGTNSILVDFDPNAQPGDVTVYGNNLCGNGTLSASLHVAVSALPGNAGTPTGEEVVCQGDTGVIYYVSPIANAVYYIWEITGGGVITTGNGTNSIRAKFPVGPVTCGITVYASNACGAGLISGVRSVLVNALPPVPVITQNGNQLMSSAPFGNQWYFNGTLIAGADQATFTPDQSGAYTVTVTMSGCSSAASDGFFYVMTGINNLEPVKVKVYPVPNDGYFRVYVNSPTPERATLSVLNGLGEKILELPGIELNGDTEQTIDLRPVPAGVYMLVIEGETARIVRKVVVH